MKKEVIYYFIFLIILSLISLSILHTVYNEINDGFKKIKSSYVKIKIEEKINRRIKYEKIKLLESSKLETLETSINDFLVSNNNIKKIEDVSINTVYVGQTYAPSDIKYVGKILYSI